MGVAAAGSILGHDGRAGKAKNMVVSEIPVHLDVPAALFDDAPYDAGVHIAKLAAVALIEYQNNVLIPDGMVRVLSDEHIQLLDGGDNDAVRVEIAFFVPILQLSLQHRSAAVAVGRALLEPVVFLDGLVVQVLAVHHKQHLVNAGQGRGKLRCLEGSQGFAAACRVPDVAAGLQGAGFLIVGGYFDPVQDPLGGYNLIGPHHQQKIFRSEHAIPSQDVQQRMPCKKGLGKIHQIRDRLIVGVRPIRSKFKTVGGLFAAVPGRFVLLPDVAVPGCVGIVLGVGAVGDDEDLHILVQPAPSPEADPLVAVDLVEGFFQRHAPAFQLHMDQRQAIHQNGHIVPGIVAAAALLILVDDLQEVVVDVLLVDEGNIHGCAVLAGEVLHKIFLDHPGLFHDAIVGVGQLGLEKAVPFPVGKAEMIEPFQLAAEIGHQVRLAVDGHIFVTLLPQHLDEGRFQRRLTLVGIRALGLGLVFCYYSTFAGGQYKVIGAHRLLLSSG